MVPIVIICYNNYKYVKNTVSEIHRVNPEYVQFIRIMDNNSTCKDTVTYLQTANIHVIWNKRNDGPWINQDINSDVFNSLPEKFIMTDPDLGFNQNLPSNFIEIMMDLSERYNCSKIGFALDISDFDKMYDGLYQYGKTIKEWESQFWNNKINHDNYELYNAAIDTTFCMCNKKYLNWGLNIRIAGNFTAKHLPFYKKSIIFNEYETYMSIKKSTYISTVSSIINLYFDNNFSNFTMFNECFLLEKNVIDDNFNWEKIQQNSLEILETPNKNSIVIDIGAGIGLKTMFLSRKAKHVYSVEHNNKYFKQLTRNCEINCENNYTLINKFICNKNDSEIDIDDSLNIINSITLKGIIENYNINIEEISLININIGGKEENILEELLLIKSQLNTRLIIQFDYNLWENKNIDRFLLLDSIHKQQILNEPCCTIII